MNIFFLDRDPRLAAEQHCDKHVVKMILESAQLLSTAHRIVDGQSFISTSKSGRKAKRWWLDSSRDSILYQANHVNHPCSIWVRSNIDHYRYLWDLYYFLIGEYKYRYDNKYHKCEALLNPLMPAPDNIPITDWADPPQAMPEDVRVVNDPVAAYRNYYRQYKKDFATWKNREVPNWYK